MGWTRLKDLIKENIAIAGITKIRNLISEHIKGSIYHALFTFH